MSYVIALNYNKMNIYCPVNINFNTYLYSPEETKEIIDVLNKYLNKGVYKLKNNGNNDEFFKFCNCKNIKYITDINDISVINSYYYLDLF